MTFFGWDWDQWEKAGDYYNRLNPGNNKQINADSFVNAVCSVGFEKHPAFDDYTEVWRFWITRRNDSPNEVKILLSD